MLGLKVYYQVRGAGKRVRRCRLRVKGNSKRTGSESVGLCPETRESQGKRMARVLGAKRVQNGCEPGIFSQVTGKDRYVTK